MSWPCLTPSHPKYEQKQTGYLELSWREKNKQRTIPALYARFRQLLGFLVTCPKIDNEPKAVPDINFFPPFALFLAPKFMLKSQTLFPDTWIGDLKQINRYSDFFVGYCTLSLLQAMPIFERNFSEKFKTVMVSWRVMKIQIISKAVIF
jgi:hypothetical protein